MKKQKVLIVHNYYQVPGGEDTVVDNEKNLLLDNGHEVVLYTRHNDEIKSRGILGKLVLPFETIFSLKTYRKVKKIIKKQNIDIVHVHNTLPLVSPSVYYAAKHCRVPVVQTIHNFRFLCPGATFNRGNKICEECVDKNLLKSIKYKCYRGSRIQSFISAMNLVIHRAIGTYKRVDGYIALTEFNKNKISNLINKDRIFIKPNFVKKCSIKIEENNRSYFIFVGRMDELKGIKLLVEAWKQIQGQTLLIVGKGPCEDEILNYIATNKINNINIAGFKRKEEVMYLISRAKALIVPSQWYEGFPMTIVESLSLGVPVIAGDIGNLSTIIEPGYNGLLFKYNDTKDLIDKINKFNNKEIDIDRLAKGASDSFDSKYNENKNYELLIDIYDVCSSRN